MDIKIITKSDTFLIYKPINTISELKHELKRFKIQLRDILIYFYDNDADKVVILDDQDLIYAIQQAQEVKRKTLTLYIYYKLFKPIILKPPPTISIMKAWINDDKNQDQSPSQRNKSETFSMSSSIPYPFQDPQNQKTNDDQNQRTLKERPTIIPIPIQTREDKLKEVIDKFIDKMLYDQYEI